jgi:predicted PurR-regulated permease PerM
MNQNVISTAQKTFLVVILVGITAFFLWIMSGFILPVIWAAIFALLLHPVLRNVKKHIRGKSSLSALLTILLALVIVFVPIFTLGRMTAENAVSLYQEIAERGPEYVRAIGDSPLAEKVLPYFNASSVDIESGVVDITKRTSQWIASQTIDLSVWTIGAFFKFLLMLYLLFFFLRDGERFLLYLKRVVPLQDQEKETIFERFSSTIFSIFKGTMIVALVQGMIGGAVFALAGIPNAVLWGSVMAFASILPMVGPVAVWVPAVIVLYATGDIRGALIVLAGGIVVSTIDNILRPILVGRDIELPDALILLAILGGIATFGIVGVILGPVIAALFLSLWNIFEKDYRGTFGKREE